ncbi:MAG: hypothetical protein M0C28_48470 [Candidatus Moduliflexus flocculans]|nr:hypothetical protein [Candidatus Moduliflexus flocculans]
MSPHGPGGPGGAGHGVPARHPDAGPGLFTSVITEGDTARGVEDSIRSPGAVRLSRPGPGPDGGGGLPVHPHRRGELEAIVKAQAARGADLGSRKGGPIRRPGPRPLPLLVPGDDPGPGAGGSPGGGHGGPGLVLGSQDPLRRIRGRALGRPGQAGRFALPPPPFGGAVL